MCVCVCMWGGVIQGWGSRGMWDGGDPGVCICVRGFIIMEISADLS